MTDDRVKAFQRELDELIDRHFGDLADAGQIDPDDPLDAIDFAEMGSTYCSGWVLFMGIGSVDNPDAVSVSARYSRNGQNPFFTLGLARDQLTILGG